jgi:hypothetical protein
MREGKGDKRGRFITGNMPWNKRQDSSQRGIIFTCKFCHKRKPLEEMRVIRRLFPPVLACRACWKLLD